MNFTLSLEINEIPNKTTKKKAENITKTLPC